MTCYKGTALNGFFLLFFSLFSFVYLYSTQQETDRHLLRPLDIMILSQHVKDYANRKTVQMSVDSSLLGLSRMQPVFREAKAEPRSLELCQQAEQTRAEDKLAWTMPRCSQFWIKSMQVVFGKAVTVTCPSFTIDVGKYGSIWFSSKGVSAAFLPSAL